MQDTNTALSNINDLISRGEYPQAISLAKVLEANEATQRVACSLLALAHALSGQKEAAFAALGEFSKPQAADSPDTLLAAGSAAFLLGNLGASTAILQAAHSRNTEHPIINARLGASLLGAGRLEAALPFIEKAARLIPNSGGAWLNVAHARLLKKDYEGALQALKTAEPLPDKESDIFESLMSDVLQKLGRGSEAEALLRSSAATGQIKAVINLIRQLTSTNRHEEAWQITREHLDSQPSNVDLLELAAELAQVRGRFGESDRFLARALEIAPDNAALWRRRAMSSSKRLSTAIAREAADKALSLTAARGGLGHALSLAAHAHVLSEEGHLVDAEKCYQEALALHRQCVPALRGMGQLMMQLGRVDDATAYYEELKQIAPLQGWSQLIHAREVPEDEDVLIRMEQAARRPSLEGPVQASMLFTLAAAWEKKGFYDKAWQFATEANEATKAHLPYRAEVHRRRIEREIARFSSDFIKSRFGYGNDSHHPVFILGMPRSGTTLVEQILGSHSEVFGAGELSLVPELIQKLNAWEMKLASRREYPECIDDVTLDESKRFAEKHLEELRAYAPDAQRIVDKLPHNFEHVGLIKLLFPNAKILHLVREPRDVAMSNYFVDYGAKFGGMGFAYDLGWIGEQLVDHDRLMQHWHSVFPGDILDISYDSLVENVEEWAHKIIDFLGLQWESGVLSFQTLDRAVKTASVWQVRQPVYTTSKAKWKRYEAYLAPLEAALADIPPVPVASPMPTITAGTFLQAMDLLHSGNHAQAEAQFRDLVTTRSNHAAAHHFLGASLAQQKRLVEARQSMRRSIELAPTQLQWLENLLKVEQAIGDNPTGIETLSMRINELRRKLAPSVPAQASV